MRRMDGMPKPAIRSQDERLGPGCSGHIRTMASVMRSENPMRQAEEGRHSMALQVSAIMIGVEDLARSKKFYADLGCTIEQDYPQFVSFKLGDGSSSLALYEREAAA